MNFIITVAILDQDIPLSMCHTFDSCELATSVLTIMPNTCPNCRQNAYDNMLETSESVPDENGNLIECSICRQVLTNPVFIQGCMHFFCYACITQWFSVSCRNTQDVIRNSSLILFRNTLQMILMDDLFKCETLECRESENVNMDENMRIRKDIIQHIKGVFDSISDDITSDTIYNNIMFYIRNIFGGSMNIPRRTIDEVHSDIGAIVREIDFINNEDSEDSDDGDEDYEDGDDDDDDTGADTVEQMILAENNRIITEMIEQFGENY